MTPEEFVRLLGIPEGNCIEFKSATGGYHFEKLLEYCVALANEGGGKIVLGVSDRRPREVVGTAAFSEPGRTEAGLTQRLRHRIPVEEYFHAGQRVLIVHVPSRLPGAARDLDGRFLKRAGDDLASLNDAELRTIFAETGPDFSAEPSSAPLAALSPSLIADFRRRWARKARQPRIEARSDNEVLTDAGLLADGRPCYGALILFGTREALGRHLAQAEIGLRLMEELADEKRAHLRGVTRSGRWFSGPPAALAQLAQTTNANEPKPDDPKHAND